MRNSMRKIIIIMVVFVFVLGCVTTYAATFKDVPDANKFYEAVDLLSTLGIVRGYEDGTFQPDKSVTRAEFTALITRIYGAEGTAISSTTSLFSDLRTDHWAYNNILTGYKMGVINGFPDGTFQPEAPVTYEQAVKMIVAMLGYGPKAIDAGGYPMGYITVAADLGILKKADSQRSIPALRGIIAQLLFNSLEVDLMIKNTTGENTTYSTIKGQNLLSANLGITKIDGTICSNGQTALSGYTSTYDNDYINLLDNTKTVTKVKIGTFTNAKDMLGYRVVAYMKKSDNGEDLILTHMTVKTSNKVYTIKAEDLTSVSLTSISYYTNRTVDSKTANITLSSDVNVIYNGLSVDTATAFSTPADRTTPLVKPLAGTLKVIDNGLQTTIVVSEYENYVVVSTDPIEYAVSAVNKTAPLVIPYKLLSQWELSVKNATTNTDFPFASLKKNNVLSVYKTYGTSSANTKGIMKILVSDKVVSGKISEIDGDGNIIINTQKYTLSPLYGSTKAPTLKIDTAGTFYVDAAGQIAWFVESTTTDSTKYGYLIDVDIATGLNQHARVQVYNPTTKSTVIYTLIDKVKIDANDVGIAGAPGYLENSAKLANMDNGTNITYTQPIKFTLNGAGAITDIDTVLNDTLKESQTQPFTPIAGFSQADYDAKGYTYNTNSRTFTNDQNDVLKIDATTQIILVPTDRGATSDYGTRTYLNFSNARPYQLEAYEKTSTGIAKLIILYGDVFNMNIQGTSPTIIIKQISTIQEEGINKKKIDGIDYFTGLAKTYTTANENVVPADLELGDVIRFGLNAQGEINNVVQRALDVGDTVANIIPNKDGLPTMDANNKIIDFYFAPTPVRRTVYDSTGIFVYSPLPLNSYREFDVFFTGCAVSADAESMLLTLTDLMPNETGFSDSTNQMTFDLQQQTPKVILYDSTKTTDAEKLTVLTAATGEASVDFKKRVLSMINDSTTVVATTPDEQAAKVTKIFAYFINQSIKTIYIVR